MSGYLILVWVFIVEVGVDPADLQEFDELISVAATVVLDGQRHPQVEMRLLRLEDVDDFFDVVGQLVERDLDDLGVALVERNLDRHFGGFKVAALRRNLSSQIYTNCGRRDLKPISKFRICVGSAATTTNVVGSNQGKQTIKKMDRAKVMGLWKFSNL